MTPQILVNCLQGGFIKVCAAAWDPRPLPRWRLRRRPAISTSLRLSRHRTKPQSDTCLTTSPFLRVPLRLQMSDFGLIILDECHRCQKNHPFNQIMQQYHATPAPQRPDVLGLTARACRGELSPSTQRASSAAWRSGAAEWRRPRRMAPVTVRDALAAGWFRVRRRRPSMAKPRSSSRKTYLSLSGTWIASSSRFKTGRRSNRSRRGRHRKSSASATSRS